MCPPEESIDREETSKMGEVKNIPELFGCDVFNEATMKKCLSEDIFQAWKHCVSTGSQLTLEAADKIAEAMKQNCEEMEQQLTRGFSEEEKQQLTGYLNRILDNLYEEREGDEI